MAAPCRQFLLGITICASAIVGVRTQADEIQLKDGQKLYGVIVAYEDNMFKVKTDFGFVLVQKDKIAAIIPTVSGGRAAAKVESPATKNPVPAKSEAAQAKPPSSVAHKEDRGSGTPTPANASAKSAVPAGASKSTKLERNRTEPTAPPPSPAPIVASNSARVTAIPKPAPEKNPVSSPPDAKTTANASPTKDSASGSSTPGNISVASATTKPPSTPTAPMVTPIQPVRPKEIEPPANREALQGNMYVNYTHGFRMYKPPSWKLIDDARKAMPNAIVAMGTSNESTLMVVGQEKTTDSLDVTAVDVEKRLRDIYGNYRRISQRKTVAGGFPAVEIHYRGLADDHDWSGTLVVVARSGDIFSVLGMTYSETDLIQIQENVIARAIASLEFNAN
jgi:hypothetical protein